MNTKKLLTFALAAAMTLSLTACGGGSKPPAAPHGGNASAASGAQTGGDASNLPEITTDQMSVSFAASVVMMLPAILGFLWGQEYLQAGIAASGLKE